MASKAGNTQPGLATAPAVLARLSDPLGFIHEDHLREREICAALDVLASSAAPDAEKVTEVLTFLTHDLPLNIDDEREDLFPLLRRRCKPEDEIDKAIERLSTDYTHAAEDTPKVVAILEKLRVNDQRPTDEETSILRRYITHARRHLFLDNAIVLPFARLRLTHHDLQILRLRMMRRRGIGRSEDAGHAH